MVALVPRQCVSNKPAMSSAVRIQGMPMSFDYIIVGAGSAGGVLAERLSANPANRVLLLEAGSSDDSALIHMPRANARLLGDPARAWHFQTDAHDDIRSEVWIRGKMLGGTSSLNGMLYFRGLEQDYQAWETQGAKGWNWPAMERAFEAIENLGAGVAGAGAGLLRISQEMGRNPLTEAFLTAGQQMGVPRVADLNRAPGGGAGYVSRNIWKGRRQSTARTFLKAARKRRNLRIVTGAAVSHVIFEGCRAVGVSARIDGSPQEFRTEGEVVVSAGALVSPQILERSGIGNAAHLQGLGIPVIADSPGVGEHLLEHLCMMYNYDLSVPYSHNYEVRGVRLAANVLRYYLAGTGPMTTAFSMVGAFAPVLPGSTTPDIEILLSQVVGDAGADGKIVSERRHSISVCAYPCRSRSEGSVHITSSDPAQPGRIRAGYLTDPYDREVTVAMHRFVRKWMQQPAIAPMVAGDREPMRSAETDEEILAAARATGSAGNHAAGTCRMGNSAGAVLDERLRVRGVERLRVVDGSIMPTMVSANPNGAIMASAWRAAELILEGRNR
jgi:choline dehydrogenase